MENSNQYNKQETILSIKSSEFKNNFDFELFSRAYDFSLILNDEYGGEIKNIIGLICLFCFVSNNSHLEDPSSRSISAFISFLEEDSFCFPDELIKNTSNGNLYKSFTTLSVESKIAHDAIILAHFSVFGIFRQLKNNNQNDFLNFEALPLAEFFSHKFDELLFSLSKRIAEKELKFINYFGLLSNKEINEEENYSGNYIIIEGNSGTGKSTQSTRLKERIEKTGRKVTIVEEPTIFYKEYEKYFEEEYGKNFIKSKPIFRLYSILGDRFQQITDIVYPELHAGNTVISVRSYLSMLVYQCETDFERTFINYLHDFVPRPDLVLIFDADEDICLERAKKRNRELSLFDKEKSLRKYRPIYQDLAKSTLFNFPVVFIDASRDEESMTEELFSLICKYLGL